MFESSHSLPSLLSEPKSKQRPDKIYSKCGHSQGCKYYQFVIFEAVLLSVALGPLVQVDGVLDVVRGVMLRRPIIRSLLRENICGGQLTERKIISFSFAVTNAQSESIQR